MFTHLEPLPEDPILGLMTLYRADPSPAKIDLGVGVYRDEQGQTPVPAAVRRAEQDVLREQRTKAYVGAAGNAEFNRLVERLVLGGAHPASGAARVRCVQAPGGCGALRIGAELIRIARPEAAIHVSEPTWANHLPLLGNAGLVVAGYPYLERTTGRVQFAAMLGRLAGLPAGTVVLLQACCHNPTGADLSEPQWQAVADMLRERGLLPFVDIAYQGLGRDPDADAFGPRLLARELPEVLIAVSCSKNFGLYRERVGALIIVGESGQAANAAATHAVKVARGMYSMAPDHGAAIVARILGDDALRASWEAELQGMCSRIRAVRQQLAARLAVHCPAMDFSAIAEQRGMFSLLPLAPAAIEQLRLVHHVYMGGDGRINVAGLTAATVEPLALAIGAVLG
jgi:aspartate/tyrosine/aromatic aminotransferase